MSAARLYFTIAHSKLRLFARNVRVQIHYWAQRRPSLPVFHGDSRLQTLVFPFEICTAFHISLLSIKHLLAPLLHWNMLTILAVISLFTAGCSTARQTLGRVEPVKPAANSSDDEIVTSKDAEKSFTESINQMSKV
ncbi:hypothetical protein, partial [uncultured Rubinisphaera sp.]|uniref:hypothetical protein n=1 Tax=uncultured Rubinisphaera sp. TaxID=1678686 RepID=UPI0030DACD84